MKFVFCENEKSNSVIKFLNNTFPQTTDFKICQAGSSCGELRLRATEKYEIRANYICTFHGPKGQQINLNLNFQSTFNDVKIMLVHSPQTNVFFFVNDKRIENLNSSIIPYLKDGYIFYDIEKQNPSYQMPQYPAPPPAMPVPSAASPVTPPPSNLTKSQSKAKPVNFEEKVEILFQFEKSIGKEIKPIKKQFKPTTTVNEMIEIIKKENDLDCEIEMSYKEEEDKVKIEPNETIKTIQQYIIQPNRQNIIYVGSPQIKPSTKAKSKKPKIKLNYDISNAENDKPSKKPLRVNGSEQELLKLREEIENYKSIIRDKTQELTRMQEEVNNQKIIISDNKKELSRLQDENENQKIEIKRLQKENQNQGIQKNKPQNKELQILYAETIENLEKIEEIGSGGGGRVFKVSRKEIYALKEMNMNNSDMNDFKHFIREYEIISMLQHPNIIKAIGIFLSNAKNAPSILLEYLPMNLSTAIKNKIFTNEQIVFCIYQIVEGMKFVHFRRIIHRDLKPTNILIASDGTIKICDFGISKLMTIEEQSMTLGIGTQKFMAPEIIKEDDNYDEKVDVYSFGVVLFFILSGGNIPKIKTGDILKGKKAEIPSTFTNFSKEIINECWNFKSKDRPSFAEILEKMEKSNFNLLDLTETELKNVKSLIKQHKAKIQSLKE